MKFSLLFATVALFILAGCVHSHKIPETDRNRAAITSLEKGNDLSLSTEQRAAWYLDSAQAALNGMKQENSRADNILVYNEAAAHLTMLLRSADQGQRWNRPQTLSHNGKVYRLRFAPASREGVWDPNLFTSFTPSGDVKLNSIANRNEVKGLGGTLVGVQQKTPLPAFSPRVGVSAAVTAMLDFRGSDVTLQLIDPTKKTTVSMQSNS